MTKIATQRAVMRDLFTRLRGDQEKSIEAYAATELRGEVQRVSNQRSISAEGHARRLFADGKKKGWL